MGRQLRYYKEYTFSETGPEILLHVVDHVDRMYIWKNHPAAREISHSEYNALLKLQPRYKEPNSDKSLIGSM